MKLRELLHMKKGKIVISISWIVVHILLSFILVIYLANNNITNMQGFSLCLFTIASYLSFKMLMFDRVKETIRNFIIATSCINLFIIVDILDLLNYNVYTTYKLITIFIITANLLKVVSAYLIDIKILQKMILFTAGFAIVFELLNFNGTEVVNYILYVIIVFGPFIIAYRKRKILFEFGFQIYGLTFLFIVSIFIYFLSGIFIESYELGKNDIYFFLISIYLTTIFFVFNKKLYFNEEIKKKEKKLFILEALIVFIFTIFINCLVKKMLVSTYMVLSLLSIYKKITMVVYIIDIKKSNDLLVNRIHKYKIEENYNKRIANFLHDDVLQDLIAIKMNILLNEQKFRDAAVSILDKLIDVSRAEIELYRPNIIYDLSLADNYYNLIESLRNRFKKDDILIDLNCNKDFFINYPYDVIIYKILHELCVNIYKHSKGNYSEISIKLENINLYIDVINHEDILDFNDKNKIGGNGIKIITDEIENLYGEISINQVYDGVEPQVKIKVKIPVKEEIIRANIINR